MRICGIELKSNTTICSVVNIEDKKIDYMNVQPKKIILEDNENQESIINFQKEINNFIQNNSIEKIVLKKEQLKETLQVDH